ncbi:MAG: signal recognition particle-docking protein FtsY [Actinobacteria bacterium]|jgi:fused signal recognition particle receptor|nr:signal recognition particle-docking protein FtsY [Actinomycetota bacterium]MCB9415213.1 signal recognition particle-docking protein FtsY [Actinomycetota bacterium]MCB9425042.1 signal recognition particle-docking protein FtsY [Actinomycetota bacterium]HNO15842.1 signal recognition particle-docking protein FtsY [Actinomycetota bacterium]HUM86928.1 signal recognition particle-docking protein FtsY [Actinomycetota bacterium]
MDSVVLYALIAVVLIAVAVLLGVRLVAGRRQKPLPPAPGVDYTPGVGDDAYPSAEASVQTIEDVEIPAQPGAPTIELERPEPTAGRLVRLRARLARSNTAIGRGLLALLSSSQIDESTWEDVEDTLIMADLGVDASTELVDRLKTRVRVEGTTEWSPILHEELLRLVDPTMDRTLVASRQGDRPAVILVVGVNGTGKTTTTGKLARVLVADGHTVVLGAADTFRAAAADQLQTWGDRVGAAVVRGPEGGDPAAVAFDAVKEAADGGSDVVVIDTAGRLHTKVGLMDELGKIKRVIGKQSPVDEVLLILDATTGQNGLAQAKVFSEAVDITGVVLTKLDGTAKGGIVVAVQRDLGVPVKLVGLGEGPDDLAPFDPEAFVSALLD